MSCKLRIAYLVHSLRSDWNNGNAHFLRGLMREMVGLNHEVMVWEPASEWSIDNLLQEEGGEESIRQFFETYPTLPVSTYPEEQTTDEASWVNRLRGTDIVILHEWNPPELAHMLLRIREQCGFRLLFHDTHHRASSSPKQIRLFGTNQFDGVIAFGEVLRSLYSTRFGMKRVWTLHEAADTSVFRPRPHRKKECDVAWVGNWGDDERSREIREFLLSPAPALPTHCFRVYGVRYPQEGRDALRKAGIEYHGYLPNLQAPCVYASAKITLHIPRQQYVTAMKGIPTIRVFEALACGIPLISAPWEDAEGLFREGDFLFVRNGKEMKRAIETLLGDPVAMETLALRGLETILARHTCRHRAEELTEICEEALL